MSDTKKEKIIGIDLGTSNSAASVLVGGKPTVVPSAEVQANTVKHSQVMLHLLMTVKC